MFCMKRKIFWFVLIFLVFVVFSFDFINILPKLWIDISKYNNSTPISRYELVRFLNLVDCFDCLHPPRWAYEKYNSSWWQEFKNKSTSNFDDIFYRSTFYNKQDYYYCIAYAADKWYIHWYPRELSPICPGKFCGANYASYADLIQILTNIVATKLYNKYYINWQKVLDWYNKLPENSILKKVFNEEDLRNIEKWLDKCAWNSCHIENISQFNTYLKYCTFNLKDCWFRTFQNLSEGQRPIAQVNFLLENGIISEDYIKNIKDFSKPVPKKLVLDIIEKVKSVIKCDFDLDYDNDWILNKDDNCPYSYNPYQKDTDNDGIWDVCDDDIDGDWIKNPVWVVDDRWNIILSKLLDWKKRDNCIFIPNPDQKDYNHNWIWDVCENNSSNLIALQINAYPLWGTAPSNIKFKAKYVWDLKQLNWFFWDWKKNRWIQTNHYYKNGGIYNVVAYWHFKDWKVKSASLTIKLDKLDIKYGLQIYCEPLVGMKPLKVVCKAFTKWNIKKIKWIFNERDKKIVIPDKVVSKIYFTKWIYPVLAQWLDEENHIVATAQLNIWVNDKFNQNIWAYFIAKPMESIVWRKILFNTKIKGFKYSDIKTIYRNFGDGFRVNNKELKMYHIYQKPWVYVVRQKIVLFDNRYLDNHITIVINEKNLKKWKWISLTADRLLVSVWERVNYKIILNNLKLSEITLIKWYFEDINNSFSFKPLEESLRNSHIFYKPWSFKVKAIVYTRNWERYEASLIQWVRGRKMCSPLEYKRLHCDMDKDGIPDLCDDDIDGDWIPNLIWSLLKENSDCKIDSSIINQSLLEKQRQIILKNYTKWEKPQFDNCPFDYNPNQKDSDLNWLWDKCDNTTKGWIDSSYGLLIGNIWTEKINNGFESSKTNYSTNEFIITR